VATARRYLSSGYTSRTPIRRGDLTCCARAAIGQATAPPPRCPAAEKSDELPALHFISLVNADQSFCDDVSHGRASRPAQLQDASNCQANDDESADKHTDRGQLAFAGETGFAHSGTEPNSLGSPAPADLFDHLVGEREHLRRYVEAERLCSRKIDDQLELRGLQNR
jgi:hypothetical protein